MMKVMNYDNRIKVKTRTNLMICYEKDTNTIQRTKLNLQSCFPIGQPWRMAIINSVL